MSQPPASSLAQSGWRPGRLIDRVLLRRCLLVAAAIAAGSTVLVLSIDLVFNLNRLLRLAERDGGGPGLVLAAYALRLPQLLGPVLPLAALGAALLATGPMLRRGELSALAASGLAPATACRAVLVLAVTCGLLDLALADLAAPHLAGQQEEIRARLGSSRANARLWIEHDSGTTWFARRSDLRQPAAPVLEGIMAAPATGGLWSAAALAAADPAAVDAAADSGWTLLAPIQHLDEAGALHRFAENRPATGILTISGSAPQLARRLASRAALGSGELLARGHRADRAEAYGRWLRLVMPLLLVMTALPAFLRDEHRHRLMSAAIAAIGRALVPAGLLLAATATARASSGAPEIALTIGLLLAATPAVWSWTRFRL